MKEFKYEKYQHYFEQYVKHFEKVECRRLLEIGVQGGGSLQYWTKMFPLASVIGIDIDPLCLKAANELPHVIVHIGDATNRIFTNQVMSFYPSGFDIIIDDGGHWPFMQKCTLDNLWPFLRNGGVYCIEDCHTSYMKNWGGFRGGIFRNLLTWCQDLHNHWRPHLTPNLRHLKEITIVDSMLFLHKGTTIKPYLKQLGDVDCRGVETRNSTAWPMIKSRLKSLGK